MEEFGFKQLRVSTRGLRFAAVMQPVFQKVDPLTPTIQSFFPEKYSGLMRWAPA
jgi:hypothetical protein